MSNIQIYGEEYFTNYHISGQTVSYEKLDELKDFFSRVAEQIVNDYHPQTVLDVGCAMGYLVAALRDKGVQAYGIDISEYAIERVRSDIQPYCKVCSALSPFPVDFPKKYDMVVSVEVAEHLPEEDAVPFVQSLCGYSDLILFSSTPDDTSEKTHINVHTPEYWAKRFADFGFYHSLNKDCRFLSRQAMLFEKADLKNPEIVEKYEKYQYGVQKTWEDTFAQQLNKEKVMSEQTESLLEENRSLTEKYKIFESERVKIFDENRFLMEQCRDMESGYQELLETNEEFKTKFEQIQSSLGFRILTKLYRIRDRLLPVGTLRRFCVAIFIHFPGYYKAGYVAKFFKYAKKHGFHGLIDKLRKKKLGGKSFPSANEDYEKYQKWISKNEPGEELLLRQIHHIFLSAPKISIVVPLYNTPIPFLKDLIESVVNQTYTNWELCLADGNSSNRKEIEKTIQEYNNSKIKYTMLEENAGISGNTNAAIGLAAGDFIAFVDHDDLLPRFALFEITNCVNYCPGVDFIYSDDDRVDMQGKKRSNPDFKPDFSPDRLRCCNYIGHLTVVRKSLMDKVGLLDSSFDGSQDYDFVLRATEKAKRIEHIPKILYHWRMHENSVSLNADSKTYAIDAAKRAIAAHLKRINLKGDVTDGLIRFSYKINYELVKNSKISIIIPTMDHIKELKKCVDSVLEKSTYQNYEIILVENNSKSPKTFEYYNSLNQENIKVVYWKKKGFNYSALINFGVENSNGEYIVTLNNDTEIITPQWMEELLMFCQRQDVGMVGAKLYYPDDTIWNTGIALGNHFSVTLLGNKLPRGNGGYYGQTEIVQNFSALAGACTMFRKDLFLQLGGLDEKNFPVAHNDMDLSLKMIQAGKYLVFTPYAELYHYESKSRGSDLEGPNLDRFLVEDSRFILKWSKYLKYGDPFHNVNFKNGSPLFEIRTEKVRYRF